jgi:hypothetical protein
MSKTKFSGAFWPATAAVAPEPPKASTRFSNITATVFGGLADPNNSAYDEHFITDTELGVALPFRFSGARRRVRVWKDGKSVDCQIVDVDRTAFREMEQRLTNLINTAARGSTSR